MHPSFPRLVALASVLVGVFGSLAQSAPALRVARLRCEYKTAPLGIDRPTPRLSWIVESDGRDQIQTAYHVLVASSPEQLARDAGDLWDSGRVTSRDTTAIRYAGTPLASGQHAWWKVRAYDRDGAASAWSEPQQWSMGLLSPADWTAEWIGHDAGRVEAGEVAGPLEGAQWIAFARDPADAAAGKRWYETSVVAPANVARAELVVSADNHFVATLNGKTVGRGSDWKSPVVIDLAAALRPGANALRLEVTNEDAGPTGVVASLRLTDAAGTETRVVTDAAWRASDRADGGPSPARELGAYGVAPWGKAATGVLLPPPAYLRHDFALAKPVRRATLHYATLGLADVYLNGERATDDYFTSGWTEYATRVYYRTYDVTDALRPGANAIGAVVADGWYSGHVGFERRRDRYGKRPRVRAQLDVEFADGTRQRVSTDETWRATNGPTRTADFLQGETYDARAEMPGWSEPTFDAAAWRPAVVGSEVTPLVQAHPAQPVRVIRTYAPRSITQPTPGAYVVDFGQNLAGVVRLNVTGRAGQTITIRHAERLNDDGTIYTTNLRSAVSIDRYTCKGGGATETWSPRFTFHGFQYVELTGLDAPPTDATISALSLSSDTPVVGTFASSDVMLNQLHSNIYQTQAMNFIDVPTDCPQRDERLGWTGDAQIYVRTATLNADVHAFFDKWLVDLTDEQRADGQFPTVAPLKKAAGDDGGPAWADAGVIVPWAIYDAYGDRDMLARQYPSMRRYLEFCVKRSTPELLPPAKFHAFGDWLSIKADTPKDVIYVAYLAHVADLMQRTATVLGHADDAAKYADIFDRAKATFRKAFVDAEGKVKGDTQCGYVLAIAFELLDAAGTREAGRRLVADIEAHGDHLSTGFIGTKDLMLALDKIGRNDVAYRLLHQDTFPSWGFSIRHGATSIWERWNGWTPDEGFGDPGMNSFAHYSFGAVYQWMAQTIGGIRNGGDAYARVVIEPTLGDELDFASTGYDSIRGRIATEWKREGGRATLSVTIPANVTAVVRLPTDRADGVSVDGKPAADTRVNGRVEFPQGSGTVKYEWPVNGAR